MSFVNICGDCVENGTKCYHFAKDETSSNPNQCSCGHLNNKHIPTPPAERKVGMKSSSSYDYVEDNPQSKFVRAADSDIRQLLENSHRLERIIIPIAQEVVKQRNIRLDIWTPSKTTREENQDFKQRLIVFYQCQHSTNPNLVKCMILNDFLNKKRVKASHIYKVSTLGIGLDDFNLLQHNLWNERNGLLLYTTIEDAFDRKEVCFLCNRLASPPSLHLLILNPSLLTKLVLDTVDANDNTIDASLRSLTFGDLNLRQLILPANAIPYRRILNWHAICSMRFAVSMGWMTEAEKGNYQPFFDLFVGATIPTDMEVDSLTS